MFEVRSYGCPKCTAGNGMDAAAVSLNELADIEIWGACWSCGNGFQLRGDRRRIEAVTGMLRDPSSPIAFNPSFSMWRRVIPGISGEQRDRMETSPTR